MSNFVWKLQILARAEMALARINTQRIANRTKLFSIAIGALLLTVVMVNLGAYHFLAETYSPAAAAFMVAAGNALLAIVLGLVANQLRPGADEKMAREIRDMALAELTADVDAVKDDINELSADVKRIRNGFSAFTGGGGLSGVAGLTSVVGMLVEGLKRAKK